MGFKKGYTPWNKGKPMLEQTRIGLDKALKGNKWNLGKTLSETTKEKMSISRMGREGIKGEKSNFWKGGITPLNLKLRASSMFKIWKEAVFLRDNFTCQNPNCEYCSNKIGVMIHAHHKKPFAIYPELRFDVSNGITYCAEFHLNSQIIHQEIKELRYIGRRKCP
jgi:hypothetical protein